MSYKNAKFAMTASGIFYYFVMNSTSINCCEHILPNLKISLVQSCIPTLLNVKLIENLLTKIDIKWN